MHWQRQSFAERLGLGMPDQYALDGEAKPATLGKADIDPGTRGMMTLIANAELDGYGGVTDYNLQYWYRRPNGQDKLINLFGLDIHDDDDNNIIVDEIYYRNKPLLSEVPPDNRDAAREILLDTMREIHTHLREGGSPRYALKILKDRNIEDIIGEKLVLPGQDADGNFSFRLNDPGKAYAKGELRLNATPELARTVALGEVNTLDYDRQLHDGDRVTYGTDYKTGRTFRARTQVELTKQYIRSTSNIDPVFVPEGSHAERLKDFLKTTWQKASGGRKSEKDNVIELESLKFHNHELRGKDTDTKIRVLGICYRIMDMMRRRRYPTSLDVIHEFDLLDYIAPTDPPPPEGRLSSISYLGNGKEEIAEGYGYDLGACKAIMYEYWSDDGNIERENIILDLGKMLAPLESDSDGALPDILGLLKDTKAICITHRHLDHMDGIVELARLGVLKNIDIHGANRVCYILEQKLKNALDDHNLMPAFNPVENEGIMHFKHLSAEYSVDALDHSTPSTAWRVVGRKCEATQDLGQDDIAGSYLFYGDGRAVNKPDFLSRGLRSFGVERQDTVFDLDLTNVQKPGRATTEADVQHNLQDLLEGLSGDGVLMGIISTNDSRLNTLYKVFNRVQRNFTAVGHNIEQSLRAHNKFGVDPEFVPPHAKDNVNKFLREDASEETERRVGSLREQLEQTSDPREREKLEDRISELELEPVSFRNRGSKTAQGWLKGELGNLAVLVTGTQGNDGETFSTLSRFIEGWSTLDIDRHTSFKIQDPSRFHCIIDQQAIPGNHKKQKKHINRLLKNRGLKSVIVAVDDGFKIYGMDETTQNNFISHFVRGERGYYQDTDGSLVITGAPIHASGHPHQHDLADIAECAGADINHGTHSNDPENTVAFEQKVCEKNGLRHAGRQMDDFEINAIEMGDTPDQSALTRIGAVNASMIVFKIIRKFGDFFGGVLQARLITRLDGHDNYARNGLTAGGTNEDFHNTVISRSFQEAASRGSNQQAVRNSPEAAMTAPAPNERRHKGVIMPNGAQVENRNRRQKVIEAVHQYAKKAA